MNPGKQKKLTCILKKSQLSNFKEKLDDLEAPNFLNNS